MPRRRTGVALADGFVPKKLQPGEKPPQFIIVSFDGVGWHEKWQHWFDVGKQVPFRFTGFLSGTYMLSDETKMAIPGTGPQRREIVDQLEQRGRPADRDRGPQPGLRRGQRDRHPLQRPFLRRRQPSGNQWTTDDWNNELDQFFALVKNVKANNPGVTMPDLAFDGSVGQGRANPLPGGPRRGSVPGADRAQHDLRLVVHQDRHLLAEAVAAVQDLAVRHGHLPDQRHRQAADHHGLQLLLHAAQREQRRRHARRSRMPTRPRCKATYDDMFNATFNGNRAPLVLGNHFNAWNNNAYETALTNFVLEKCGQPDVQCVPFQRRAGLDGRAGSGAVGATAGAGAGDRIDQLRPLRPFGRRGHGPPKLGVIGV